MSALPADPLADQFAAAATEAEVVFGRLARLPAVAGGTGRFYPGDQPSWMGALLRRHNDLVAAGEAYQCEHLTTTGPQVRFLALWRLDLVVCSDCLTGTRILSLAEDDPANRTCDKCGQFRPQGVRPGVAQGDHFVILYGQCTVCLAQEST